MLIVGRQKLWMWVALRYVTRAFVYGNMVGGGGSTSTVVFRHFRSSEEEVYLSFCHVMSSKVKRCTPRSRSRRLRRLRHLRCLRCLRRCGVCTPQPMKSP